MTRLAERLFVWAGGAAFLSALTATAWLYARTLSDLVPSNGWRPGVLDALLITLFATHHSLFARASVKTTMARLVPDRLLRSVYVWVASLLLLVVCGTWQRVGGVIYQAGGGLAWMMLLVPGVGLGITVLSVRAIDPLELAGIRPPQAREQLQVRGLYGLVRHPVYLGWVLMVFGAATMTGDRLTFAVLTTAYLVVAIPWEERSLEREFGPPYERYKERVRWRILPYLY